MRPDVDPNQGELGVLIIIAIAVVLVSWFVHYWLDMRPDR